MRLSVNIVNFVYLPEKEYIGFLGFQHEIGHFIHLFFHIIHTIFHRRLLNFPAYSVYFEFGRNFFPIFINSLWKTEEAAKKVNIPVTRPQIVPLRH